MADDFSQLQTTVAQLERVIAQLAATSPAPPPCPPETVQRLERALQTLAQWQPPGERADQDPGWDEPWEAPPSPPMVPKKQGHFGILSLVAAALLGVGVGVLLWVGIPGTLPPLWDQATAWIAQGSQSSLPVELPDRPRELPTPVPEAPDTEEVVPAVLEAPAPPQAIAVDPLPPAPLTPEQSLLAVIQQELVDLEGLYPPQLIDRIEPDFAARRLTITLGPAWTTLPPKKQATLGATLWQRAQKLSFQSLRLYDAQGTLVGRSPVVGRDLILLGVGSDP